jgi:hypothetical protein
MNELTFKFSDAGEDSKHHAPRRRCRAGPRLMQRP